MKNVVIKSFVHGFKDSFRLAVCLFVSVASIIAAFSSHQLGPQSNSEKQSHRRAQ